MGMRRKNKKTKKNKKNDEEEENEKKQEQQNCLQITVLESIKNMIVKKFTE